MCSLPLPCGPGQGGPSLIPFCLCFQAMRFPPKSYNKDLESAEVRSHLGSGLPACGGRGLSAPLATLPRSDTFLPTSAVYPCRACAKSPIPALVGTFLWRARSSVRGPVLGASCGLDRAFSSLISHEWPSLPPLSRSLLAWQPLRAAQLPVP